MNREQLKNIIEAALMVADKPLGMDQLMSLFDREPAPPDKSEIREVITELTEDYADRGIELNEVASGFRIQVRAKYAEWISRLFEEKPPRYSRALLETLAIIVYRQPLTRAEIEDIRGVSVNTNIIRTLLEREWIRVVGHRDVPGRPELLATTREFLDYFNLKKLSELPPLPEVRDLGQISQDLFGDLDMQVTDPGESAEQISRTDQMQEEQEIAESEFSDQDIMLEVGDDDKVVPITH